MNCVGCDKELSPIEQALSIALDRPRIAICNDCVKARAAAAMDGRCHCGNAKRSGEMITVGGYIVRINGERRNRGGRSWIPCKRCLGVIRQVS